MTIKTNVAELRQLFAEGQNLLKSLRDGGDVNEQDSILLSYDLQAGSYTDQVTSSAKVRANKEAYGVLMADILRPLAPSTILDAGTGEATSLFFLLKHLDPACEIFAFDISLSRLLFARNFLASGDHGKVNLFTASLDNIPLETSAIDTVVTNHALEPNGGREIELLTELMRIAGRYIVLVEPSWELGGAATRARIDEHRYVKDLPGILTSMGAIILRHELWQNNINGSNEGALIVAEVPDCAQWSPRKAAFRSPIGFGALHDRDAYLFSPSDGFLFPKVEGVPCLLENNGVLAARLDEALSQKTIQ